MRFIFKAKTKDGDLKEGIIDAVSTEVAVELLQKNDLLPLSIQAEKQKDSLEKILLKYYDKVDTKELMVFFRQLSILIEAKVPIVASLVAIKEQMNNHYFRRIVDEIIGDIQDGLPLSDALKKHKDVFSTLSINIIKSGEVSGNLRKSVEYVANNIEKNYTMTQRVKSAMTYPVIVMIVFFIIAFLVVTFVIPKLTQMIKDMEGVAVPWYTTVVITISDFMAAYWWAIAIMILGFVGGIFYYIKTEDGSKEWDRIKIRLPIFGTIYQYLYVARFADNLSVLLAGGIPIIQALKIVSTVIGNTVYEDIFSRAAEEVKVGGVMSDVFRRSPQIPPIVVQMVKIGEESGQTDLVLGHVAKFYEQEATEMAKNLSTLIEPLLMVIIGAAVAFLAFSVIMPIYNIAGQL